MADPRAFFSGGPVCSPRPTDLIFWLRLSVNFPAVTGNYGDSFSQESTSIPSYIHSNLLFKNNPIIQSNMSLCTNTVFKQATIEQVINIYLMLYISVQWSNIHKFFDRNHPVVFCNNIVIYSVNKTTYIGNQYWKFGNMFRLIKPSSGQIQKYSIGTFSECTHNVCTHWMYQYYQISLFHRAF
jgi:hypothetical protein